MATPLFRTIQTDAQRLTGLVDPRAPGWAALTAFLLLSTAAAAGFVATAPYARRQTAIGLVAPQAGTVRVSAPRPGIMAEIFVVDGALVAAGDALFSVDYRRALQAGDTLEASTQRALERQELNKKIGPWRRKSEEAEQEIDRHERRKAELEALMAEPDLYSDQERWSATSREYGQVERHLERAFQRWEEAQAAIEAIEKEL